MESAKTPTKATPHEKRGISFFWIVPVLAVALTAYLFYQTMQGQGTTITITFATAKELVPDKTELHFHGVKVGVVKSVELSPDFKSVIVKAQLDRDANDLARKGTEFWIVHPQIGINGISGLDTLISGNYIQVQQGNGDPETEFTGLESPSKQDPNSPDLFIQLQAATMPSVGMDSPIVYKKVVVGNVEDLNYDVAQHKAIISIRIYEKYKDLVRQDTHFWNTSGIDVSMGLSGVTVRSDSLSSMIFGSISMGIPDALLADSPTVADGTTFQLFDSLKEAVAMDAESINKTTSSIGQVLTLHLKDGTGIVAGKTNVVYRGVDIGDVVSIDLAPDLQGVVVKVLFINNIKSFAPDANQAKVQGFARANTRFLLVWPQLKVKDLTHVQVDPDVVGGPYFRVEPGDGAPCTDFAVSDIVNDSYHPMDGLVVSLHAAQVGTLRPGAPVYYRGVPVGQIENSHLADDATTVDIRAVIQPEYAALVRSNSQFWNSTGLVSKINIWGGVKVNTQPPGDSLEGSVSFATPDNLTMAGRANSGTVFPLADKADDAWLKWQPKISLN
jgi:paraquat-inducible protein B